ncbi:MAG: hypothetical protein ABFQ62_02430 [Patescibacteria group bacterium]
MPTVEVPLTSREMFKMFYGGELETESVGIATQGILAIEATNDELDLEKTKVDPELETMFVAMSHETGWWTKTTREAIMEFETAKKLEDNFGDPLSYAAIVASHRLISRLNHTDKIRHKVVLETRADLQEYFDYLQELFLAAAERLAFLEQEKKLLLQKKNEIVSTAIETESVGDTNTTQSLIAINGEITRIEREVSIAQNNTTVIGDKKYELEGLTNLVENSASQPNIERKINLSKVETMAA